MSWLFSQVLVEAFSEAHSWDGEPCAQLNVMLTAQPYLRNDKPMDVSRFSRFGLTSRLLTVARGEDLLTWFLEDFLVRTSPSQVTETDSTESGPDSGGKWFGSFTRWNPETSTWRTPQCSLLGGSDEFSETWPNSGSMRNGECWERSTLELHISESGSGLLPTPVAIDTGSRFNRSASDGAALRPTLGAMARFDLWPTPMARGSLDGGSNSRKAAKARGNWPTPTARDHKGPNSKPYSQRGGGTKGEQLSNAVIWRTPNASDGRQWSNQSMAERLAKGQQLRLTTQVSPEGGKGGLLNPEWVEWLMGWPIGWTALQPLGMDKFLEWQQQHGADFGEENEK